MTMISSLPLFLVASKTYSSSGLLATGSMTLGMVSVNGLSRLPSPAAKMTAFFIMTFTELYGLVLYLSFFFDMVLFFVIYLNSSVYKLYRMYNKKIVM